MYVTADYQQDKQHIRRIKKDFAEIQSNAIELLKRDSIHIDWFDKCTFIWKGQLDRLNTIIELADECHKLLESVEKVDENVKWRRKSLETLKLVMASLTLAYSQLSWIFDGKFNEPFIILKSLKGLFSSSRVKQIDELVDAFIRNPSWNVLRRQTLLILHKIQFQFNFIKCEILEYQKPTKKNAQPEVMRIYGAGKNIEFLIQHDFRIFNEGIKGIFESFVIGLTPTLKDTSKYDLMDYTALETTRSKYQNIIYRIVNLPSNSVKAPSVFNKWFQFSKTISSILYRFDDLFDLALNIKMDFSTDGKHIEAKNPIFSLKAKTEILQNSSLEELMLNLESVIAIFKLVNIKLSHFYGKNTETIWTFIRDWKPNKTTDQLNSIQVMFDNSAKTSYHKDLDNLNDLSTEIEIIMDKAYADNRKCFNSDLFELLSKFEKGKKKFYDSTDRLAKFIDI